MGMMKERMSVRGKLRLDGKEIEEMKEEEL